MLMLDTYSFNDIADLIGYYDYSGFFHNCHN